MRALVLAAALAGLIVGILGVMAPAPPRCIVLSEPGDQVLEYHVAGNSRALSTPPTPLSPGGHVINVYLPNLLRSCLWDQELQDFARDGDGEKRCSETIEIASDPVMTCIALPGPGRVEVVGCGTVGSGQGGDCIAIPERALRFYRFCPDGGPCV